MQYVKLPPSALSESGIGYNLSHRHPCFYVQLNHSTIIIFCQYSFVTLLFILINNYLIKHVVLFITEEMHV